MSRILMCGFEAGSLAVLSAYSGVSISTTQARSGSCSLYVSTGGGYGTLPLATSASELYLRVGIRPPVSSGDGIVFELRNSSNSSMLQVGRRATGILYYTIPGRITIDGTRLVPGDQWFCLQVYLNIASSGGRLIAYVDATQDVDYTGNTQATTPANVAYLRLGSGIAPVYFDDVAVNNTTGSINNSWPGRGGIYAVRPSGAGAYTEWSVSGASANWDAVDEVPPSTTDYVYTAEAGKIDTYQASDLSTVGSISAVRYYAYAQLNEAGEAGIKPIYYINNTAYEGTAIALEPSWRYASEIVQTNPATGNAWTVSEINAMQLGVKSW
jgi:hypothetical protein